MCLKENGHIMRNKIQSIVTIVLIGIMSFSCHKEEVIAKVQVKTDKNTYMDLQDIIIAISNNSDELLEFYICNGKQSPTYELQRYSGQWVTIDAAICNGFSSYCCGVMKIGETKNDTLISNWLDKGKYRFKYSFGTDNSKIFYSNQFNVD
jgi:hypothetical protein